MITKRFLIFVLSLVAMIWLMIFISKNHKPLGSLNNSVLMQISSSAFANDGSIPDTYTCSGFGINPPLQFSGIPTDTQSLVLIMDDPDATNGTFTHWVVYNMSPKTVSIPQNSKPPGIMAENSAGTKAYIGPCPPSGEHRYFFRLYALNTILSPDSILDKKYLLSSLNGHVLDEAQLTGRFKKSN